MKNLCLLFLLLSSILQFSSCEYPEDDLIVPTEEELCREDNPNAIAWDYAQEYGSLIESQIKFTVRWCYHQPNDLAIEIEIFLEENFSNDIIISISADDTPSEPILPDFPVLMSMDSLPTEVWRRVRTPDGSDNLFRFPSQNDKRDATMIVQIVDPCSSHLSILRKISFQ